MNASTHDDRILPVTRWTLAPVAPLLLGAFVVLTFWPDRTTELFAWTIKPNMSVLLLGSGYGVGSYLILRLTRARVWHTIHIALLALCAFATLTALATVLHWDRFNQSHVVFVVWVLVYAILPFQLLWLWWRNRSADPRVPDANEVIIPAAVRWVMTLAGLAEVGIGLLLFISSYL